MIYAFTLAQTDDDVVVSSVSYEKPCDDMGGAAVEDWLLTQGMRGIGYRERDE